MPMQDEVFLNEVAAVGGTRPDVLRFPLVSTPSWEKLPIFHRHWFLLLYRRCPPQPCNITDLLHTCLLHGSFNICGIQYWIIIITMADSDYTTSVMIRIYPPFHLNGIFKHFPTAISFMTLFFISEIPMACGLWLDWRWCGYIIIWVMVVVAKSTSISQVDTEVGQALSLTDSIKIVHSNDMEYNLIEKIKTIWL